LLIEIIVLVDPLQEEYLRELTDYLVDKLRPVAKFYPLRRPTYK